MTIPKREKKLLDRKMFKSNIHHKTRQSPHLRQIKDYLIFAWVFRTSWTKVGFFWGGGQNRERGGAILIPANSFLLLGVLTSVPSQFWRKSIKKCDREGSCRRTDTLTD